MNTASYSCDSREKRIRDEHIQAGSNSLAHATHGRLQAFKQRMKDRLAQIEDRQKLTSENQTLAIVVVQIVEDGSD